jgi:hypothetical protein
LIAAYSIPKSDAINGNQADTETNIMTVLIDLQAQQNEELRRMIETLAAENAALRANAKPVRNGLKVSEKGAVSIYGYARFPITMYKATLLDILNRADELRQFVKDNDSKLASKPVKD